MSHVIIVSAVYPPEPPVSARMSQDLANALAEQGNSVTVVCPQPTRPLGTDYSTYSAAGKVLVRDEGGIEVVRLPSFASPQSKLISRMRESWSFGKLCCRYLSDRTATPDALYVNAWPLFGQALITGYAKKRRIPLVLQIMDIYPESMLNRLPDTVRKAFARPLRMLDYWIACQATSITVISENMRKTYTHTRRIPEARVVTVPTWQDETMFESVASRDEVCRRYGVSNDLFTFVYLGNIGPVAGVDFLIRAFHSAGIKKSQLLIIGDGSEKISCEDLVHSLGGRNIIFISDPDARNVPQLQSMADVCILPLKRGAGMSSVPSKLPAYMFSAKPVLATVDELSDTAHVIRQANCGWLGRPEDMNWLVDKMREVTLLPAEDIYMYGQNGRDYGLAHYSKTKGVLRLAEVVLSAPRNFSEISH